MTVDQLFRCKPSERLSAHISGIVQYGPSGDPKLRLVVGAVRSGKTSSVTALSRAAKRCPYVLRGERAR